MVVRWGLSGLCVLALSCGLGSRLHAQDPEHVLGVTDALVDAGAGFSLFVLYDNTGGDQVSGWSYGVAHDPEALTLEEAIDGSTTATVNSGFVPAFDQINQLLDGFTVGVVISFIGASTLPPGLGYELSEAMYTNDQAMSASTEVCLSATLGSPPVATVVVVDGQSVIPTQDCGTVTTSDNPPFIFSAHAPAVPLTGSFDVTFCIADGIPGVQDDTQGFSMGVANDPEMIQPQPGSVQPLGVLASLDPQFFGDTYLSDGWTVGVVYSFESDVLQQYDSPQEVVRATYDIVGAPTGGTTTTLTWSDSLGTPPVENIMVVDGQGVPVALMDGFVEFGTQTVFLRGDCNSDAMIDVADAVWLVAELFVGGAASTCPAACDANSDSAVDSSDAVYLLSYRYNSGPPPSAPFPGCGASAAPSDIASGCLDGGCL